MTEFDLQLLGRVQLTRDGVDLPTLPPQATTALKILVLHGPAIHPDRLADAIWPGEPQKVVRKRLRNVLTRVRADTGARIEGRRDEVVLHDTVKCDLTGYINTARRVLSGNDAPELRRQQATELLDRWKPPMLEDLLHLEWAQQLSTQASALQERLLGLLSKPMP